MGGTVQRQSVPAPGMTSVTSRLFRKELIAYRECTMHHASSDHPRLIDRFGRRSHYVPVSLTDPYNLRCVYCMAEDMEFLPKAELLTLEELDRLCTAFVRRGVRKLRLTGGEPLMRRG